MESAKPSRLAKPLWSAPTCRSFGFYRWGRPRD
jgi:hypothetical protein